MSRLQIGSSVAAMIFFLLIAAYWVTTPEKESIWIPALFGVVFGIIALQEWRRRRRKTKETQEAMEEGDASRSG